MKDYTFKVLPFEDIDSARNAIAYHFSVIKIRRNNNCDKMNGIIRSALIIGKALLCFENNFNEFKKLFHIEYISKVLWEDTTWEIQYRPTDYTYKVYSGTTMGPWSDKYQTVKNSPVHIGGIIISQAKKLLMVAEQEWPSQRFLELYNEVRDIIAPWTSYKNE